MHDPAPMRLVEGIGKLDSEAHGLIEREGVAQ